MANDIQLLVIAGGALIGSAFILFILSNPLATWSGKSDDSTEATYGLWGYCTAVDGEKTCEALTCPSEIFGTAFCNKVFSARTFLTLACILSGISTTLSIIYCAVTVDTAPRLLLLANKILVFACLLSAIIGVVLGINATMTVDNDSQLQLGDGAIIGIVGIGINLLGAIATVLIKQ